MYFFLDPNFRVGQYELNAEESKHGIRVLRLKEGDQILIGDGDGQQFTCEISSTNNYTIKVKVLETNEFPKPKKELCVAISPTKNLSRFEWFLEKATELGVSEIVPIITTRTERPRIKEERSEKIILTASKQSQRAYIPKLLPTLSFQDFLTANEQKGIIAHCLSHRGRKSLKEVSEDHKSLILIGPEGDFTPAEIDAAERRGFQSVVLNENRLRTETAGIFAVAMLQMP